MEYSRDHHARKRCNFGRVDLSFDFTCSSRVCSHQSFDVMKAHLECVVSKATDKKIPMRCENLIHNSQRAVGYMYWDARNVPKCEK